VGVVQAEAERLQRGLAELRRGARDVGLSAERASRNRFYTAWRGGGGAPQRLTRMARPRRGKCFSTAGRNCRPSSPLSRLERERAFKVTVSRSSRGGGGRSQSELHVLGDGEVGVRVLGRTGAVVLQRLQQVEEAGAARRLRRRHHRYSPPQGLQRERERDIEPHREDGLRERDVKDYFNKYNCIFSSFFKGEEN